MKSLEEVFGIVIDLSENFARDFLRLFAIVVADLSKLL